LPDIGKINLLMKCSILIKNYLPTIAILALLIGCKTDTPKNRNNKVDQYSYDLGAVAAFSEIINAGVKQLALSAPMSPDKMHVFSVWQKSQLRIHKRLIFNKMAENFNNKGG